MQSRTLSIFLGLAVAAATALAQSSTPVPAQPDNGNQQVGIAGQSAPDASAAQAAPQRRAANPQRQAKFLARQLGLSRAQQAQIRPIFADRQQQIESLRADTTLTARDRHGRM